MTADVTIFNKISVRIVKEQELIIGPVAWDEARKVSGFVVLDQKQGLIQLNGDTKDIIDHLVAQYERLFGRASHEVCKDAVKDLILGMAQEEIPASLK